MESKISLINWHLTPQKTPLGNVPCAGLDAAYEGLLNIGLDVRRIPHFSLTKDNIIFCWGWKRRVAEKYRFLKRNVLVLELGYIGDRTKNISVGWNGLNGYAEFPEYPADKGERFRSMGGVLKPWKTGGEYILILGQVKGDASLKGKDIMPWYQECASRAKEVYGLPVYFRPHPESKRRRGYESVYGIENMDGTLQEGIDGALFTISYNSNSCLDSIMAGTPCYAGDMGTLVYDLCMKDIENIVKPDREKVIYEIAWKQWTLEEIRTGKPFIKALEMKGI